MELSTGSLTLLLDPMALFDASVAQWGLSSGPISGIVVKSENVLVSVVLFG